MTVSDNGDGTLKTEVTYPDGSDKLAFENEYDTSEVSIPVTGLKLLENEHEGLVLTPADIAGRFTFTLTGVETTPGIVESAAPVPVLDGREMTEAVNGVTGEIDFGRIVLQASDFEGVEPGEHDYVIREVVPAGGRDANTIFDTAGHSVHVSVKDNKDGTLSVTSSASEDDHIVFNNKQVKKDDPSKGGDHGANGGSHTNTGDSTPVGMIIAIMIAALCIIAVVIIISRRKSRK